MRRAFLKILALTLATPGTGACGDDDGDTIPYARLEARAASHDRRYDDFCVFTSEFDGQLGYIVGL